MKSGSLARFGRSTLVAMGYLFLTKKLERRKDSQDMFETKRIVIVKRNRPDGFLIQFFFFLPGEIDVGLAPFYIEQCVIGTHTFVITSSTVPQHHAGLSSKILRYL